MAAHHSGRDGIRMTASERSGAGAGIDPELVDRLVAESREFDAGGADPERNCWMAVHRHVHGVPPSEYDIREVPEDLYLAVLERRRSVS
jgi:hypothetical protein